MDLLNSIQQENVWEDLVLDYLEVACFLSPNQRDFLIDRMRRQKTSADSIEVMPAFLIDGRLILIAEQTTPYECWTYKPREQRIFSYPFMRPSILA